MENNNQNEILINFRKETLNFNLTKMAKALQISPNELFNFFEKRNTNPRTIKKLTDSHFNLLAHFILERLDEINPENHKINKTEAEIKKIRKDKRAKKRKGLNLKSTQTSIYDRLRNYKHTPYIFKNRMR
ncbi:hypothetical protein GCM10023314_01580 [Algibacter agarivorans]|uniref:HTH cro/C1-type domain-containing protein n=1 Tax=Algibacter agarivorans TaxID=1109741 RepID=A0ABP9G8H1_9FLAO